MTTMSGVLPERSPDRTTLVDAKHAPVLFSGPVEIPEQNSYWVDIDGACLRKGDPVQVVGISPRQGAYRYLQDETGTVQLFGRTRLVVLIESTGRTVRIVPHLVRRLAAPRELLFKELRYTSGVTRTLEKWCNQKLFFAPVSISMHHRLTQEELRHLCPPAHVTHGYRRTGYLTDANGSIAAYVESVTLDGLMPGPFGRELRVMPMKPIGTVLRRWGGSRHTLETTQVQETDRNGHRICIDTRGVTVIGKQNITYDLARILDSFVDTRS